jgi:glycosyltransferase
VKTSIITVAFNSERTILDTLRSVADQTHPAIEHIIVDGGSTDGTLGIVRAHATRVAHLVSEPDRGIYDAMNKGLRLASGDLIGFLNADDMLAAPDAIARLVAAARGTAADVLFGDLVYVREDDPDRIVRYWDAGTFSPDRLRFGWMPPHPTFYVTRETRSAVGEFDTELRIAADYDFMVRCLGRSGCRAVHVPGVFVKMRMGGASNRSLGALWRKSREDMVVLRRHELGGLGTLLCKVGRKVPQLILRRRGGAG